MRVQFFHYIKNHIRELYGLPGDRTAITRGVEYLLEADRLMCPSNGYEVCIRSSPVAQPGLPITTDYDLDAPISFRFLAPQIADVIYGKYFNCKRKLGMLDLEFIKRVNGTLVCLTCAILCHQLRAYRLRVYQDPPDFKPNAVASSRPSMSPQSLVFVQMTNQSCKTVSYGRRTPGG